MKNEAKKPKTTFTATEVGALIEDLRSRFRIFGKDLSSMKERLNMLFEELGKQKENIFIIKADIRFLKNDVAVLKNDVAEIKVLLKDHTDRIFRLEGSLLK